MKLAKISERIFFSTIKITVEKESGDLITGTGFFLSKTLGKDEVVIFLVAPKKLIENTISGIMVFHEAIDSNISGVQENENIHIKIGELDWKDLWYVSSKNISPFTIAPIVPIINFIEKRLNKFCFIQPIDIESVPKVHELKDISIVEDILFLAYPPEIVNETEYMPVLGRAKLATALFKDFNHEPMFLINTINSKNTEGGPVFILNEGTYNTNNGKNIGNRFLFLGVNHEVIENGLGKVIKASVLLDIVDEFIDKLKR